MLSPVAIIFNAMTLYTTQQKNRMRYNQISRIKDYDNGKGIVPKDISTK